MILLLLACNNAGGAAGAARAVDFAGPVGRVLVFSPSSAFPDDTGDSGDTAPAGPALDTADTGPSDTGPSDTGPSDTGPSDTGPSDTAEPAQEIVELRLEIGETEWSLVGQGVNRAYAWKIAGGLVVDDVVLMPAAIKVGASADGCEVTAVDALTVRYGTFPEVASVTVSEGNFAGDWAFARDVGAVQMPWSGQLWELVYYQ